MTDTVLVTGATGFIAKHIVAELLRQGYAVRGTARDAAKGLDIVQKAMARAGVDATRLSMVTADLTRDEGWDAAASGCRYAIHVASPFPITQPNDADEVVRPAREGTLRVLRAATKAGVPRVVLTSSTVAVMYTASHEPGHVYSEADWTDTTRSDITPYIISKTLAEQAAWAFARETGGAPELAVVNPGFVQGPALDPDLSTSLEVQHLMGKGAYPGAPRIEFPVADVRDVAEIHVKAMTSPAAAGERFIAANGTATLYGIGQQIAAALPDLARKVPRFEMPDVMVRGLAVVDKRLRTVLPELGIVRVCSNAKARDTLGHEFRSAETAIRDAALSLRALKII
ncbi:MAG: aldehyde reductase [Hyphomicrobiaceae bacterium]|nr:aldehyde reductase [Hyphomicrobiaceae bacterium]